MIDATSYFAQQQHVVCEHDVCLVCDDVAFCHALVSNSSQRWAGLKVTFELELVHVPERRRLRISVSREGVRNDWHTVSIVLGTNILALAPSGRPPVAP